MSIEISKRPHLEIRLSLVGGPDLRPPCCPFWMVSHWPLSLDHRISITLSAARCPTETSPPYPTSPLLHFVRISVSFHLPGLPVQVRASSSSPGKLREQEPSSAIASTSISIRSSCAALPTTVPRVFGDLLVLCCCCCCKISSWQPWPSPPPPPPASPLLPCGSSRA